MSTKVSPQQLKMTIKKDTPKKQVQFQENPNFSLFQISDVQAQAVRNDESSNFSPKDVITPNQYLSRFIKRTLKKLENQVKKENYFEKKSEEIVSLYKKKYIENNVNKDIYTPSKLIPIKIYYDYIDNLVKDTCDNFIRAATLKFSNIEDFEDIMASMEQEINYHFPIWYNELLEKKLLPKIEEKIKIP